MNPAKPFERVLARWFGAEKYNFHFVIDKNRSLLLASLGIVLEYITKKFNVISILICDNLYICSSIVLKVEKA